MSPIEEHKLKIQFIENMPNKYDYLVYKNFCINNNLELMAFSTYAELIEPSVTSIIGYKEPTEQIRPQPCCGGGKVL